MEIRWIERRSWWQIVAFFAVLILTPCCGSVVLLSSTFGSGPGPIHVEVENRTPKSLALRFDVTGETAWPAQSLPSGMVKSFRAFSQDQRLAETGFRLKVFRSALDQSPACSLDLTPKIRELTHHMARVVIENADPPCRMGIESSKSSK